MPGLGYIGETAEGRAWIRAHSLAFDGRFLAAAGDARPVSFRGILPVEQQGQMGSCSGHMMACAQQTLNYQETRAVVRPSRMLAYLLGQKFSGTFGEDHGGTIEGAVKGAMAYGNCLERDFPYPDHYVTEVPNEAISRAAGHKIGSHVSLSTFDGLLAWLRLQMGVGCVGIKWWESFAENRDGVLRASDYGRGRMLGGHAVPLLSETEQLDEQGRPFIDLRNSHGTEWGDGGWVKVEPALIEIWLRDGFTELIGVTKQDPWSARRRIESWGRAVFG